MDIKSPLLLKLKGALFLGIALISTCLLLLEILPVLSWKIVLFFILAIWAFCRAYYFCFYVLQNYADPSFRYAGLWDLCLSLAGWKKRKQETKNRGCESE